jgi:transcriptional regulator with XRE-family HTH domain
MRRVIVKLRGLRQARQRSGLSISQLADITDLRRDTITHLEHGKEEPQPYVLRRLATALNATTAELVGVSVIESPPTDLPPSSASHGGAKSLSAAAS